MECDFSMEDMFSGCSSLESLNLSSFSIPEPWVNTDEDDHVLGYIYTCQNMLKNCSGLKTLTIPSSAGNLNSNACSGVGTKSAPCTLVYPAGFTPEKQATGSGWYQWKTGYFKDQAAATEPYAVLSSTTLTFYYDSQRASRSGTKYDLNSGTTAPAWSSKASSIKKVVFNSSFASARPTTCYSWFADMTALTTVTGLTYLNTSSTTVLEKMFYSCSALTSLDLSKFNTAKVTNMKNMFDGCTGLTKTP